MNTDKLFEAAKAAGIAPFEARFGKESRLSISLFNTEIENLTVAENGSVKLRGLVDGKCGVFTSDRTDDEVIPMAIAAVKEAAVYGQPVDPEFFVKGGEYEYERLATCDADLAECPTETYISIAKRIAEAALAADKRIECVETQVEYVRVDLELVNSNGLKLMSSNNYVMIFAQAKTVDGDEIESGMHYVLLNRMFSFDCKEFAKTLVKKTVGQLGGKSVDGGTYTVVYSPDCVAPLMGTIVGGFSAFDVEQHVSLLEGKVGSKIFSDSLTVEQTPIGDEPFCRPFDDEGVPCKNSVLIDKGVPTGYVYDLATAKRAGVGSTGNGRLVSGNMRPSVDFVTVKSGEKSLDEVFAAVGSGVYITNLAGIHAGLNPMSGAYSLQASGYVIENGKITRPVSLITVAGNIMTDFADIVAVANDSTLTYYGVKTPSIAVKGLKISGIN